MSRIALVVLSLMVVASFSGCGKTYNQITLDKVKEVVIPSMNTREKMDWGKVDELLGKSSSIDLKAYEKLVKQKPHKDSDAAKIWRGKRGTFIAIEYDSKTEIAKGINGSVSR